MRLDSTTYHYQAKPDGHTEWPVMPKRYTPSIEFLPDNLSFDIHVTAGGDVTVQNIFINGQRVLKGGKLSQHRVHQDYWAKHHELPPFAVKLIAQALEERQAHVIVKGDS